MTSPRLIVVDIVLSTWMPPSEARYQLGKTAAKLTASQRCARDLLSSSVCSNQEGSASPHYDSAAVSCEGVDPEAYQHIRLVGRAAGDVFVHVEIFILCSDAVLEPWNVLR